MATTMIYGLRCKVTNKKRNGQEIPPVFYNIKQAFRLWFYKAIKMVIEAEQQWNIVLNTYKPMLYRLFTNNNNSLN
jgi:hypothetical protein